MPERRHDVVIVGASVSGLVTARALIARGRSVVVIDQRMDPSRNSSFHGLVGIAELTSVGVDSTAIRTRSFSISGVNDLDSEHDGSHDLWSVPHQMLLESLQAGVDVVATTTVTLIAENGVVRGVACDNIRFPGLVTVLTDQSDPRLAEGPSLRPDWAPTQIMHLGKRRYANAVSTNRVLTSSGTSSWGQPSWTMVVPYQDEVTVTAAMVLEDAMTSARHITELLDEIVARGDISMITGGTPPLDEFTEVVPIGGFQSPPNVAGDGVVLVGDVLGLTNPMTRDGLSNALRLSPLAVDVIETVIELNDARGIVLGELGDRIQQEMVVRGRRGLQSRIDLLHYWMELDITRGLNWTLMTKPSDSAILGRKRGRFWSIVRKFRS